MTHYVIANYLTSNHSLAAILMVFHYYFSQHEASSELEKEFEWKDPSSCLWFPSCRPPCPSFDWTDLWFCNLCMRRRRVRMMLLSKSWIAKWQTFKRIICVQSTRLFRVKTIKDIAQQRPWFCVPVKIFRGPLGTKVFFFLIRLSYSCLRPESTVRQWRRLCLPAHSSSFSEFTCQSSILPQLRDPHNTENYSKVIGYENVYVNDCINSQRFRSPNRW